MKSLLQKTPFYKIIRTLYRIVIGRKLHPLQFTKTVKGFVYKTLGSNSSSWDFVHRDELYGKTIISAGLGEDGSFDIEFASEYNCNVIIIDPTPRAVIHFNDIINNLGLTKDINYIDSGKQPINAYELSNIKPGQLLLVEKALWNKSGKLRFYEPPKSENVSHSVTNFQNNYSTSTSFIEVDSISFEDLLNEFNLKSDDIPLIKLDIEGAEIEVLLSMLSGNIRPNQILVEFDELDIPSEKSFKRVDRVHENLLASGYKCCKTDGQTNFLYLKI